MTYEVWWGFETSAPPDDVLWARLNACDPGDAALKYAVEVARGKGVNVGEVIHVFVRGHGAWRVSYACKVDTIERVAER